MAEKPEKKSILDWISSAIYEKVETAEDGGAGAGRQTGAPPPEEEASHAPGGAQANPADLAAQLREEVSKRGPAFTQFLGLVASFADIIPDEAGRYRAALKALEKTGGFTAEQVLLAGKDQLQALESQREAFAEAVGARRQALRESSGGVEGIRAKLAELERSISALRAQEQGILREVAGEEDRIKAAEGKFSSLLGGLQDEITAAREKIKKYL